MSQPPMVSEDQFNAELDKQSTDPNESNVFDNTTPDEPNGRVEQLFNPPEPQKQGWEPVLGEDENKKRSVEGNRNSRRSEESLGHERKGKETNRKKGKTNKSESR